jgi:hypothetical protein
MGAHSLNDQDLRLATPRRFGALAAALLACGPALMLGGEPAVGPASASTNTPLRAFMRFETTGRESGHLDTAMRSYARKDGVSVALIAVVHVGDRSYYDALQRRFEGYDALLYEMIREGGARPGARVDTDNPVSQVQLALKDLLDLEFQLDRLDYSRTNFVHADLDPQTFSRLQEERGESILGLMLQAALEAEDRQKDDPRSALSSFQMFWALMGSNRSRQLKFLIGQQMDQLEAAAAGLDRGRPTVLVSGRNAQAIQVLQDQIKLGKRTLGIFYGAGHMPDLERRLADLGFQPAGEQWLTAWRVGPGRGPPQTRTPEATNATSALPIP